MKVLVTGATGFVGSHLSEALAKKGHQVYCLVRHTSDLSWIRDLPVKLVIGDVKDRSSLAQVVTEVEYIYHFAGLTKALNEAQYMEANYRGTVNLLETCAQYNTDLRGFLYCSSLAAAGPSPDGKLITEADPAKPITPYGFSKLEAEKAVLDCAQKFPVRVIRPPAVYGPRDRDIYLYFRLIKKGIMPSIGSDERYLSLIYVKDLVKATLLAAESEKAAGKVYFVSDGKVYIWAEVARLLALTLGVKPIKVRVPTWILPPIAMLSRLSSMATKKPALLNNHKLRELRQKYWVCDSSKANLELGFEADYTIEKGFPETARWYLEQGWL